MVFSFDFSGPSGGIPGVEDPNPFSLSAPDLDLGIQSAVNMLNPNPVQLLGSKIIASNPFTGGPIQTVGERVTRVGDFLGQFSSPTSDPLGGLIGANAGTGFPALTVEESMAGMDTGGPLIEIPELPLLPAPPPETAPEDETVPAATTPTPISFADEISQILDEAAGVRRPFAEQFQDLLSGRFDPATSPVFVAQREAIEDQFRTAEDQIRATLPRGPVLNSALAKLSSAKARSISDTLSNILGQEREKAFQFATGQTATGLGAMEGAERLSLSRLLGEKGLELQETLGKEGLELQRMQLENAIKQAVQEREERATSDIFEFITDILGL
jgi:hypothetical protein